MNIYQAIFEKQADFFKTLAHPQRLEVIHLLRDQELAVTDIYQMLDLPQSTVSQQLMKLRSSQVVVTRRQGRQIFYKLASPHLIKASDLVRSLALEQCKKQPQCQKQLGKNKSLTQLDAGAWDIKKLVPLVHDPVCEMRISPKTAAAAHQYQQKTWFFCGSGCLKKFKDNPHQFIKHAAKKS